MSRTSRIVTACVVVLALIVALYAWTRPAAAPAVPMTSIPVSTSASAKPVATTTPASSYTPQVILGGQTIDVTLAQTPAQQAQGLGGRASLGSHEGMLFIFPQDGYESFWMKDMEFSIDMIWLSDDGTVVYIKSDVSPSTYPDAFTPTEPARYVLELPANFAQMYGITVGSKATLP